MNSTILRRRKCRWCWPRWRSRSSWRGRRWRCCSRRYIGRLLAMTTNHTQRCTAQSTKTRSLTYATSKTLSRINLTHSIILCDLTTTLFCRLLCGFTQTTFNSAHKTTLRNQALDATLFNFLGQSRNLGCILGKSIGTRQHHGSSRYRCTRKSSLPRQLYGLPLGLFWRNLLVNQLLIDIIVGLCSYVCTLLTYHCSFNCVFCYSRCNLRRCT